ncbi:MAG: stage III sporulation protein AE [Clostridia bacterium]|nr:stage III sporulation protein AE [Clostridia bacterium]
MDTYVDMPSVDNFSETGTLWLDTALPEFDFSRFVEEISSGKNIFRPDDIFNSLFSLFAKELYSAIKILAVITAIMLIGALLENLKTSFNRKGAFGTEFVIIALISALAGEIFLQSGSYAGEVSENITKLMWSVLPAMLTLTAGSGFVQTVALTNPILYFMCNMFAELFNKVLIPLSVAYFAIALTDLLTDTVHLTKLRELIKKAYNFLLGLIMTIFTGLLTVSSFAGHSLDSVGAKGVKFAVSSVVPFVGRSISDAMGAVVSASVLLKNAVGITAIITMVALCVIPVLKIATTIIAIRVCTAICEPISGSKGIEILSSAADSLSMINAAVIATVMMMIISLSLIVGLK